MNFQKLLTFYRRRFLVSWPASFLLFGLILAYSSSQAQQTNPPASQSRIDSLNLRRMSPSFLLWQNMRTNPLFPYRNPFLRPESPFLPTPVTNQNVQVLIDSTLRYNIVDELDSTRVGNEQEYDFEQFSQIQEYKVRQDYWRSRESPLI